MNSIRHDYAGSTFSFMWKRDALSAMREMREIGLNDFDIIMVPGHLWPDELSADQRRTLRSHLTGEGIRIESLNLPALDQNIASQVPEARMYSVELYARVMRLGAEIGAKSVVVVPGRVSSLFPPPFSSSEGLLRDSLEKLLRVAEDLSQTIFIESHPQTPIPTADTIAAFLSKLDHPRLKVAYDVSNAEYVGENQTNAIRMLASKLGQVHLSDGTRTQWRHDRVGLGTVPFREILRVLDEIDFQGARVLEIISNEPIADITASLNALEGPR